MLDFYLVIIFAIGYTAIAFEHKTEVNKAAAALLTAVVCWLLVFLKHFHPLEANLIHLNEHLANISQVVIFLLGAMTIVELISAYNGFDVITSFIRVRSKRKMLWAISFITFFLSAVLDNLTTSIVMVALMRRFIAKQDDRFIFASMIIVAANAGGAWSPIGDVTTTMLWMGGFVEAWPLTKFILIPSAVSIIVPLLLLSRNVSLEQIDIAPQIEEAKSIDGTKRVLWLGIAMLIFVPILRSTTGLPPYMGIILGLSVMWVLTDILNRQKHYLRIPHALTRIDISSVLFFLGILLAVAALETAGILHQFSTMMDNIFKSKDLIVTIMGIISSVIDNVPLTAAAMGMYDLAVHPVNSQLWILLAYCVGVGGSILIIGSAAGVVVMGMEKINFMWYLKKISLPVLIGYLSGVGTFLLLYPLLK